MLTAGKFRARMFSRASQMSLPSPGATLICVQLRSPPCVPPQRVLGLRPKARVLESSATAGRGSGTGDIDFHFHQLCVKNSYLPTTAVSSRCINVFASDEHSIAG